jgi:hypothetical protein
LCSRDCRKTREKHAEKISLRRQKKEAQLQQRVTGAKLKRESEEKNIWESEVRAGGLAVINLNN